MPKNGRTFVGMTEKASDHFGQIRRLPPASFRGMDCRDLAEQYRRVRALQNIEPDLPDLLSVGAESAPWAHRDVNAARKGFELKPRKLR